MTDIRATLLLEVHRAIASAAEDAVAKIGRPRPALPSRHGSSPLELSVRHTQESLVVYPPTDSTGAQLSTAETDAIVGLSLSSEARSGLEKLIADASASAFFRFFCLLGGVGDPEVQPVDDWYGAAFAPPSGEEEGLMLHDEFFDSYSRYRELTQSR